jgi:hypothetical protein
MKISRVALYALSMMALAGVAWGQANAPAKAPAKTSASKAAPPAAKATPAAAALLANVQIVKGPNGKWRCVSTGGRPCSDGEWQATTVTRTRSNVKDNLMTLAPDGTLQCVSAADGKPCAEATFQEFSAEVKKAITKSGSSGF